MAWRLVGLEAWRLGGLGAWRLGVTNVQGLWPWVADCVVLYEAPRLWRASDCNEAKGPGGSAKRSPRAGLEAWGLEAGRLGGLE